MTDISELVKRLRLQPARYEHDVFWSDGAPLDAADVLEAQAKRIAFIEAEKDLYHSNWQTAQARISELEAENTRPEKAIETYRKSKTAYWFCCADVDYRQ